MLTLAMSQLIVDALKKHVVAGNYDGPFQGLELGLYTNQITPTPANVVGDLMEATFIGYSRNALGSWGVDILPEGQEFYAMDQPLSQFISSDAGTNQTIYGCFLADAATHMILYAILPFANPVQLIGLNAAVTVALQGLFDPSWNALQSLLD